MSHKYLVLNSLLCFLILLLAVKTYETWNRSSDLLPNAESVSRKSETKDKNPVPMMNSVREPTPIQPSNLISERNIFSPERKDFPALIVAAVAETKKTVVHPQVVLYGVTITEDYQSATVVNPGRTLRKDERETLILKLGERIGEYRLAKIFPDRITMEGDEDSFEVLLYDPIHPKKKMEVKTETKPVMVSSTQPAPLPPPGETPKVPSSQESVEKPKEPTQAQEKKQIAALPYNKYTYQLLGPSAAVNRGKIVYSPSGSPARESMEN